MTWKILLTPTALKLLKDTSDRRIREKIGAVIDRLAEDPEKQGKALLGELSGLRSIWAVGQRYRIIYQRSKATRSLWSLSLSASAAMEPETTSTSWQKNLSDWD